MDFSVTTKPTCPSEVRQCLCCLHAFVARHPNQSECSAGCRRRNEEIVESQDGLHRSESPDA